MKNYLFKKIEIYIRRFSGRRNEYFGLRRIFQVKKIEYKIKNQAFCLVFV